MSSLSMYDVYYVVGDFTISLIGIAANLFVVFLVVRCAALRTAPNVYVASLAVTDFILCLWNLLLYMRKVFRAVLDVNRIVAVFLLNASVFLLVAIAVERYNAILRPLMHLQTNTLRRAVKTCFLVVFAAVLATTLDTVGRIAATNDWNFTGKSINNESFVLLNVQAPDVNDPLFVLSVVEFFIGYVIPACTSLFIYVRISIKLCQSRRFVARGSADQAFLMAPIVTLFFLICCLPIHIWNLNAHFFITNQQNFFSIHIAALMLILNSVGNPFLYALLGKNFRLQIKRMFCCSSSKRNLRTVRRATFTSSAVTQSTRLSTTSVQLLRIIQVSHDIFEDVEVAAKIEEETREMEDIGEDISMAEDDKKKVEERKEDIGMAQDAKKKVEETGEDIGMAEDVGNKVEETGEDSCIDIDVEKAIGELEDVEEKRRELEETEEDTSIAEGVLKEMGEMEDKKEDNSIAKDILKKMEEMEFEERKGDTRVAEDVEKEKRGLEDTAGDLKCESHQIAPQY